jgi:hypothetical protein
MAKNDSDRFTLHKGDLQPIEFGTGPTLAEMAKRGQSFTTAENGRILIFAENGLLERVVDGNNGVPTVQRDPTSRGAAGGAR